MVYTLLTDKIEKPTTVKTASKYTLLSDKKTEPTPVIKPTTQTFGTGLTYNKNTPVLPFIKTAVASGNVPKFESQPAPDFTVPTKTELAKTAVKSTAKGVANVFTGSSQKFGNTLGTAASVVSPEVNRQRDATLAQNQAQIDNYLKLARETEDKARKERFLKAAQALGKDSNIDVFNNPEYQKTAKQVFGEALGTVSEMAVGSFAGKAVAGKTAVKAGLKEAAKDTLINLTAPSLAYGVATGMQADKDLGGIAKEALVSGAVGTGLGLGLQAVGKGLGKAFSKAPKVADDLTDIQAKYGVKVEPITPVAPVPVIPKKVVAPVIANKVAPVVDDLSDITTKYGVKVEPITPAVKPQNALGEVLTQKTNKLPASKQMVVNPELKTAIAKTKDDIKLFQEEKKNFVGSFLDSKEGQSIIEDVYKTQVDKDAFIRDANKKVISGIKNNPYYKKEGTIKDVMGSGYVMEKNGKTIVADSDYAKTLQAKGWTRGIEVDSLASEAGFDNGFDYLNYQLELTGKNHSLTKPEKIAHETLMNSDDYYISLNKEIDNLKNQVKSYGEQAKTGKVIIGEKEIPAKIPKEISAEKAIDNIIPDKKAQKLESRVYSRLKEQLQETDVVEYSVKHLKDLAKSSTSLIEKNPDKAYRVSMGLDKPKGIQTSASVNIALAEKALSDGQFDIASSLVKNRSLAQTARGQEIVSEKLLTDNSTQRYLKELISRRLKDQKGLFNPQALKGDKTHPVIRNIKEQAQKAVKSVKDFDIADAQSFIDSIICK